MYTVPFKPHPMHQVRRGYFLYELFTGIHVLEPWERHLFTGLVVLTLAVLLSKCLY